MFDGKRLKELRKRKGLTQDELGNIINVTKVSICCYENGSRTPNMDTFLTLIETLDTTPNYLLGVDTYATVREGNTNYTVACAKEDYEILKAIKKDLKVYDMFRSNPQKVIKFLKDNFY